MDLNLNENYLKYLGEVCEDSRDIVTYNIFVGPLEMFKAENTEAPKQLPNTELHSWKFDDRQLCINTLIGGKYVWE